VVHPQQHCRAKQGKMQGAKFSLEVAPAIRGSAMALAMALAMIASAAAG
jgi:hypothetical protein